MEKALHESEELLRLIVQGTSSVTGGEFVKPLVRNLATGLRVRYAFVTECTDATATRVRMLAFWMGKEFGENIK